MNVICMCKWMLFSHKRDQNPVMWVNMSRIRRKEDRDRKTDKASPSNKVNHLN